MAALTTRCLVLLLALNLYAFSQSWIIHATRSLTQTMILGSENFDQSQVVQNSAGSTQRTSDSIIYVDGVRYNTIAAALAALPATGGTIILTPHYRETFTSTYTLGNAFVGNKGVNSHVTLQMMSDVLLTCNITDNTPCFRLGGGSSIRGSDPAGGGTPGIGSVIQLSPAASVASVIQPAYSNDRQQNLFLQNVVIEGDGLGTSRNSGAMVDLFAIGDQTLIDNVHIYHFDGIGLRINGANGVAVCCSVVLNNVWIDGARSTSRPLVIMVGPGRHAVNGVFFYGGSFTNAGPGQYTIEMDGAGQVGRVTGIHFSGTHIELDQFPQGPAILIKDAQDIDFSNVTDTTPRGHAYTCLFQLQESVAKAEQNINLGGIAFTPATSGAICDTISIPQKTHSGQLSSYTFFVANQWMVKNNTARMMIAGAPDHTPGFRLLGTSKDSDLSPDFQLCDSGLSCWQFRKNGTALAQIAPGGGIASLQNTTVNTNIMQSTDSSLVKQRRNVAGCATEGKAAAVCTTPVIWKSAFGDTNYTVSCNGNGIASGVPMAGGIQNKLAGSIEFRTIAATPGAAQFETIECVAIHD